VGQKCGRREILGEVLGINFGTQTNTILHPQLFLGNKNKLGIFEDNNPMGNCPFVDFKSGWRISNPASGSQIRLADFKSG
jgi:hypothetical protein